jgi:hypothetical protein
MSSLSKVLFSSFKIRILFMKGFRKQLRSSHEVQVFWCPSIRNACENFNPEDSVFLNMVCCKVSQFKYPRLLVMHQTCHQCG